MVLDRALFHFERSRSQRPSRRLALLGYRNRDRAPPSQHAWNTSRRDSVHDSEGSTLRRSAGGWDQGHGVHTDSGGYSNPLGYCSLDFRSIGDKSSIQHWDSPIKMSGAEGIPSLFASIRTTRLSSWTLMRSETMVPFPLSVLIRFRITTTYAALSDKVLSKYISTRPLVVSRGGSACFNQSHLDVSALVDAVDKEVGYCRNSVVRYGVKSAITSSHFIRIQKSKSKEFSLFCGFWSFSGVGVEILKAPLIQMILVHLKLKRTSESICPLRLTFWKFIWIPGFWRWQLTSLFNGF